MYTIKRTHSRDIPILLKSKGWDEGPYYLVDRGGYGVSWTKPAYQNHPTGERSGRSDRGDPYRRVKTWVPIYNRAALAFALVEANDDVSPKLAKSIADKTYNRVPSADPAKAERYAYYLLSKHQARR